MTMQFFLFMFDSPVQIALVAGVIMLIFGAGKLPQLAKSLGQSRKAFKDGLREAEEEEVAEKEKLASNAAAPQLTKMSDEELLAEMQKRVEAKSQQV